MAGLGREANRIEAGRVLGQTGAGVRAHVDRKTRRRAKGRGGAKRPEQTSDSMKRAKRALRSMGLRETGTVVGSSWGGRIALGRTG